ncbi:Protein CL16A [Coemansia sp. Benny D115]|nr:Protein CL16A [Coemansia sp. Benny D115]
MFEHFLNILGIQQQPDTDTDTVTCTGTAPAPGSCSSTSSSPSRKPSAGTPAKPKPEEDEAEKRRSQILALATYLATTKPKRSTCKSLVESIRQVSELTIWCDRRCPDLLSLVIEQDIHQSLLRLLSPEHASTDRALAAVSSAVSVQVLQTLSIILDGITDAKFLYALFSNNFVNRLIAAPLDLDNEEVLPYYVAFLKALSLKLTPDTIHFFFNENLDDFPLYTTAIGLFDHPDSMVRVAVRAITLNVFRINDRRALEFILDSPACMHFWEQIMHALKDSYDDAFRILVDMPPVAATTSTATGRESTECWASIDLVLEAHMGLLAYLNDIYGLGVERINRRITDEFKDRILVRTYVHAIEVGWRAGATAEETLFMQVVTLFIAHFFAIIRYSPLLIDTLNALFVYASTPQHQQHEHQHQQQADDAASLAATEQNSPATSLLFIPPSTRPISDHYGGDDPQNPSGNSSLPEDDRRHTDDPQYLSRLTHPFVLSPFESSRTLMPWLCAALEILGNKAISPTHLVKSILTPRRMLRTRALLESLTGNTAIPDFRSFSSSGQTELSAMASATHHQPLSQIATTQPPKPPATPLPPYTQAIVTAMVQVLADSPPVHNWITVDLAALLLAQLSRTSRGQIVLDPGLADELIHAHQAHSSELRATLLATTTAATHSSTTMSATTHSNSQPVQYMISRGSWKVLVKCLVDFANSNADALRIKVQSEARFIFKPVAAGRRHSQCVSTSSRSTEAAAAAAATAAATAVDGNQKQASSALASSAATRSSTTSLQSSLPQHSTASESSPFENNHTPEAVTLAATLHQAYHLNRLCSALHSDNHTPKPPAQDTGSARGLYAADLQRWLGSSIDTTSDASARYTAPNVTVIDNSAKKALPKSVTRLGFTATLVCQAGCLCITTLDTQKEDTVVIELIWPLADAQVTPSKEHTSAGDLPVLRIQDTPFPALFYPPRPQSLGGINTATASRAARVQSFSKSASGGGSALSSPGGMLRKKLPFTYFATQRPLDITLRFVDKIQRDKAMEEILAGAIESRKQLANIILDYNVI